MRKRSEIEVAKKALEEKRAPLQLEWDRLSNDLGCVEHELERIDSQLEDLWNEEAEEDE